jgi:paraquat-inducible protein A
MSAPAVAQTAIAADCASCHECGLLARLPAGAHEQDLHPHCPRCGSELHARKPRSLERCTALVIAAALCYVPANVLPVMTVTSLGRTQSDTIMSGVTYLLTHGMWPLAGVVFIASVCVPVAKLVILSFLLITVRRGSSWRPVERTKLYRITEAIGRWSMVDIYVVTILVALVHLGNLASIEAGLGAVFFGSVVVITMLAAEAFDPRLIWDRSEAGRP